jgi:hypothetical protein
MLSRAQHTHSISLLKPAASPAIPTVAGARHLAVDRPSQVPSGQIGPTTVIPCPRPCLAMTPSSQNQNPGEEPLRTSPAVGLQPVRPPHHPLLAPSASPSLWHVGPRPRRRPRVVPPLAGQVGCLPTRPRAPALGWAESPLAQLAEEISFLFPFSFLF